MISARNQISGTITHLIPGPVNAEVHVATQGETLVAVLTQSSVQSLELAPGRKVVLLIKASAVLLAPAEAPLSISARNVLSGRVQALTPGAVNGELALVTEQGLPLYSVVTNDALRNLNLREGKPVRALIKASSILVGVGD